MCVVQQLRDAGCLGHHRRMHLYPSSKFLLRGPVALLALLAFGLASAVFAADKPQSRLAITHVRIVADARAAVVERGTILIDGERIRSVRAGTRVPRGYSIIDGTGLIAVPGYWNSHAHIVTPELLARTGAADGVITDYFARNYLTFGFTTVLDLASETSLASAIAKRIDSQRLAASRLLTAGSPFYPPGGTPIYARPIYEALGLPNAEIVDAGQASARVDAQAEQGVRAIKIFSGAILGGADSVLAMRPEDAQAIVKAAHARGLPVFAHPTNGAGLDVAVSSGVDVLAHAAPLAGEWSRAFAADLAARGIGLVPTLRLFELFPDPSTPLDRAVRQAQSLHEAGGDLLFGTDSGFSPEFDPRGEWRLMARFMDWREILASMTTTPARRFGESRRRGRLAPGMTADIVLLSADPAEDVANFSAVARVFRSGRQVYGPMGP